MHTDRRNQIPRSATPVTRVAAAARLASGVLVAGALVAGTAFADSAPVPASSTSLPALLAGAGITVSGYVDATAAYFSYSGAHLSDPVTLAAAPGDFNTFEFQQAGLTVARQPSSGFGALLNVVATPYASVYVNNDAPDPHYYLSSGARPGEPRLSILQGYVQYATGPWAVIAGKFTTLAGAEVYAPTGNTNVTRSILFTEEPVTHTGVRASYAASSALTATLGINNGWFNAGDQSSFGSGKTLEAGVAFTPGKRWSWTVQNYYGREPTLFGATSALELFDTVLTWKANDAVALIGTADLGSVASTASSPAASWWGVGGYLNYQINPEWRVSLRGEFFDDRDGYLTDLALVGTAPTALLTRSAEERLEEGTVTLAYAPTPHFEFRLEGRYDAPDAVKGASGAPLSVYSHTAQGWLEGLFKF